MRVQPLDVKDGPDVGTASRWEELINYLLWAIEEAGRQLVFIEIAAYNFPMVIPSVLPVVAACHP